MVNPNAHQKRLGGPSKQETESHQYQALQLLNQLLSIGKPIAIAGAFPNATNHRACVSYQPHGKLQNVVQDFFAGHTEGIWGLLLTKSGDDSDDEGDRDVKPDAWEFLQWLVQWWEADQAENGGFDTAKLSQVTLRFSSDSFLLGSRPRQPLARRSQNSTIAHYHSASSPLLSNQPISPRASSGVELQ